MMRIVGGWMSVLLGVCLVVGCLGTDEHLIVRDVEHDSYVVPVTSEQVAGFSAPVRRALTQSGVVGNCSMGDVSWFFTVMNDSGIRTGESGRNWLLLWKGSVHSLDYSVSGSLVSWNLSADGFVVNASLLATYPHFRQMLVAGGGNVVTPQEEADSLRSVLDGWADAGHNHYFTDLVCYNGTLYSVSFGAPL